MRILIAEDDARLLKSLVHIFGTNNYAVDGVDNGIDAFDFASSGEYDRLVLDIMMPQLKREGRIAAREKNGEGLANATVRSVQTQKCPNHLLPR